MLRLTFCTFFLAAALVAQAPKPPSTAELFTRVEKLIAGRKNDEALVELLRIRRSIEGVENTTMRATFTKTATGLIAKVDPLLTPRRATHTEIARHLDLLARDYVRKKWFRTAVELLRAGERFDAAVVAKRLAYATKRLAAKRDAEPAPAEAPNEKEEAELTFRDFRPSVMAGEWQKSADGMVSPRVETATVFAIGKKPRHEDARIRCQLRFASSKNDAWAGILVGARGADDYFIIEAVKFREAQKLGIVLMHYDGEKVHTLAKNYVKVGTVVDKADWHEIDVKIRGANLECSLDDIVSVRADGPREAHGTFGVFISGNTRDKSPVEFRKLRIGPVPPESNATPDASQGPAAAAAAKVAAEVQAAQEALDGGDRETAARRARTARITLESVSPALRKALQATIDGIVTKADPLLDARRTARTAIADELARLARGYVEAAHPRTALYVLDAAASFDAETAANMERALEAKLTPTLALLRGLPAEPERATDNALLNRAFEKGKKLWTAEGWKFEKDAVLAPRSERTAAAIVSAKDYETPTGRVRVQARSLEGGSRGVILGYRSQYDFWLAYFHERDGGQLTILQHYGGKWNTFGTLAVKFEEAARTSWMTFDVQWDEKEIAMRVGASPPLSLARPKEFRPGKVGLWTGGLAGTSFRNFELSAPLPSK